MQPTYKIGSTIKCWTDQTSENDQYISHVQTISYCKNCQKILTGLNAQTNWSKQSISHDQTIHNDQNAKRSDQSIWHVQTIPSQQTAEKS